MKNYPCIGCGLCCTKIREIKETKDENYDFIRKAVEEFPYGHKEDGSCENLMEDGLCAVYLDRPLLCNIEKIYESSIDELGLDRVDFFNLNIEGCFESMIEAEKPELIDMLIEECNNEIKKPL